MLCKKPRQMHLFQPSRVVWSPVFVRLQTVACC